MHPSFQAEVAGEGSPVAAWVGIDWADQKHAIALRSRSEPTKVEHESIKSDVESLCDWIGRMQQRFGQIGKVLVCLEQSRGALIYQLMGYGLFELYPINPSQLASYRKSFKSSGSKDDPQDAELLCELLFCHRDRLRVWKPDDELTRKLATLNEGRRLAVERRTELANEIKSQLKLYFPLALQLFDQDVSSQLAADLLVQWPRLEALQKVSHSKLRKFFYGHHSRSEQQMRQRLELIKNAQPLTRDPAVIDPGALRVRMLAQQLKSLWPYLALYDGQIAELFGSHPDHLLFENLPGAGDALGPRLLTAFGTDRNRFQAAQEIVTLNGVAPVIIQSGQRKSVHARRACPKFQRQSFHEFANCSIRYCVWARQFYEAQRAKGKTHHTAVRALSFKWSPILYACWKNRTPYNDTLYLQALSKRASPLAPAS